MYENQQYNYATYAYGQTTQVPSNVSYTTNFYNNELMQLKNSTNTMYNNDSQYSGHYNTYFGFMPQQNNYQYMNSMSHTQHINDFSMLNNTRSDTPDKQIMNDSGIETSPYIQTLLTNQNNFKHSTIREIPEQEVDKSDTSEIDEDEEENDENDLKPKSKNTSKNNSSTSLLKPPKAYLEIIADAVLSTSKRMMQLHEIYNYMSKKYPYFAQNVNKSWRNSVRHNLSLNECFVKAGRGTNGKGNYWRIHNLCEPDFLRGNFRRKHFKQLIRSSVQANNSDSNSKTYSGSNFQNNFDKDEFLNTISANYGIQWNV